MSVCVSVSVSALSKSGLLEQRLRPAQHTHMRKFAGRVCGSRWRSSLRPPPSESAPRRHRRCRGVAGGSWRLTVHGTLGQRAACAGSAATTVAHRGPPSAPPARPAGPPARPAGPQSMRSTGWQAGAARNDRLAVLVKFSRRDTRRACPFGIIRGVTALLASLHRAPTAAGLREPRPRRAAAQATQTPSSLRSDKRNGA